MILLGWNCVPIDFIKTKRSNLLSLPHLSKRTDFSIVSLICPSVLRKLYVFILSRNIFIDKVIGSYEQAIYSQWSTYGILFWENWQTIHYTFVTKNGIKNFAKEKTIAPFEELYLFLPFLKSVHVRGQSK